MPYPAADLAWGGQVWKPQKLASQHKHTDSPELVKRGLVGLERILIFAPGKPSQLQQFTYVTTHWKRVCLFERNKVQLWFPVGMWYDIDLKIFSPEDFHVALLTSTWDMKKVNSLTRLYFKPEECPPEQDLTAPWPWATWISRHSCVRHPSQVRAWVTSQHLMRRLLLVSLPFGF
jgi:hypothetical protein